MGFGLAYCIDHSSRESPGGIVALGFKVTVCGARGDITIRRRNPAGDRRALFVAVGIIDIGRREAKIRIRGSRRSIDATGAGFDNLASKQSVSLMGKC